MLEKIRIQNFQAHTDETIKFGKKNTTIVGPSDAGKSAIIRALYWIFFNRPSGDAFIRKGAKFVRVVVWLDGHKIERKKSKTSNLYVLDGKRYKAFGSAVPEPIQNVLCISELNFQNQHDAPFWFSLSPGQVSKSLNEIINLQVIDNSLAFVAAETRKRTNAVEFCRERVFEAKKKRKELEWLDSVERQLVKLERTRTSLDKGQKYIEELSVLLQDAKLHQTNIDKFQTCWTRATELAYDGWALQENQKRMEQLTQLLDQAETAAILTTIQVPNLDELEQLISRMETQRSRTIMLKKLIADWESAEKKIEQGEDEIRDLETLLRKKSKGVCPVCQSPMS